MKLAVTFENGNIFQHFGHTENFKIYDIENGVIKESRVVNSNGAGHGALAGFLKNEGVDVLICGGIGADPNWMHVAQKMNFLLTAQKAKDLGLDPAKVNDSYAMSEIARQFEMGKNPTSKTNLLKTLQMVVTAMVGDGHKATSHDVNFLLSVYSKKNRKALTVSCANHRNFRGYVMEVCHRIVTGKSYELEYKTKRENG